MLLIMSQFFFGIQSFNSLKLKPWAPKSQYCRSSNFNPINLKKMGLPQRLLFPNEDIIFKVSRKKNDQKYR